MKSFKYCPSCQIEKPLEGGKFFLVRGFGKKDVAMWRCAHCVERKQEAKKRKKIALAS